MNGRGETPGGTWRHASKERDSKKLPVLIQNLRPRICYVLSLLRIHRPDCEHCMARQTCGDELRKRLEELDGRNQPSLLQLDKVMITEHTSSASLGTLPVSVAWNLHIRPGFLLKAFRPLRPKRFDSSKEKFP